MSFCSGCPTCVRYTECTRAVRATWISRKAQNWIGYIGTVLFMAAAFAVSSSTELSGHPTPFALFLVGHLLWGGLGYLNQERPLIVLNGLYALLDLWALSIRL